MNKNTISGWIRKWLEENPDCGCNVYVHQDLPQFKVNLLEDVSKYQVVSFRGCSTYELFSVLLKKAVKVLGK